MSQKTEFIWWHQVGRSLRLLEEVSRHLAAGESFLLSAPGGIPWEASFRQRLRETASETDSQRRLRFVTDTGQDPGKYCMEELCPKEWAQKRWPSVPRPSYLCQNPSLPFHKLFLWVSALEGEKRLEAWTGFIKEYEREAEKAGLPSRAVFILESQKGQEKPSSLPRVDYSITE